jgi:hypothetical protein
MCWVRDDLDGSLLAVVVVVVIIIEGYYPRAICSDCASEHGGEWPEGHVGSFYLDKCGWCRETKVVTAPRDYGYPEYPFKNKK